MKFLKRIVKRHTHNLFFKSLAGLGRAFNKLYENRNHDIFSNGEANLLKKLGTLNPQIIFDVGANVGEYAQLVSAHCPSAKIYSFEPVQSTFELLCTEVGKNKKIHPYKNGFYKEGKEMQINLYDSNAHSSIYDISGADQQATDMETIHLISGDVFMRENAIKRIDFLKLDVEGAEMDALQGLEKALKDNKIRMIQFEYGTLNIATRMMLLDFYNFFKRHNYIVGKLYPREVEFREYAFKHEDFIGPNFIAIHQSDHELKTLLANN